MTSVGAGGTMAQRRRPAAGPISLFHVVAGKAGTDARIGLEAGRRWAPGGGAVA